MRQEIEVAIEICREEVVLPEYKHENDAGMDICSAVDTVVYIGETIIVPTGLKVAIPDGYEIQVRPRSGLSLNTPLRVANSPGTVDSGYRDEIGIIITNTSIHHWHDQNNAEVLAEEEFLLSEKGNKNGIYKIKKGDRIAQIVLKEVPKIKWVPVDSVKDIGINRNGGFGSTGVK